MNSPARILVVEDVQFSRSALISMLNRLNYEAEGARNGYEAIEKASVKHYDLVLTDIHLNDMEGMTLAETLRHGKDNKMTHLPIVAMTSYGDAFLKACALSSGINDFFEKPLTFDLIRRVLKKWLK